MSTAGQIERAEIKLIACNYKVNTRVIKKGALAYVSRLNPGGGYDRLLVVARSRGGRWIEKWESLKVLGNFRLKAIQEGSPRFTDHRLLFAPHTAPELLYILNALQEVS